MFFYRQKARKYQAIASSQPRNRQDIPLVYKACVGASGYARNRAAGGSSSSSSRFTQPILDYEKKISGPVHVEK